MDPGFCKGPAAEFVKQVDQLLQAANECQDTKCVSVTVEEAA